ncbi:MAG TPA: ABC transporter ATP-binding protein [Gaiellaceae bacterium]|nr:ABC transporter ATP-binding protein [Gaiellaceae bacterium]
MAFAISFEQVSKHYRGALRYRSLRDDLVHAGARVIGLRRPPRGIVKALDEIDLQIDEGESLALIGPNGAGKTTALKVATRISYPTSGRVCVRGRVGALIEVGTGMHPELTGRENIDLYGRILGLPRRRIQERFAEIVDFAGVGPAIDQPVKHFSSGMQLRLGFALASYVEPDILLVDEAIAVGDAGFQYRCIERMAELVRDGKTLVFVSHDMSAVEALCKRAVLLRGGRIVCDAPAREVVREYLAGVQAERLAGAHPTVAAGGGLEIVRVSMHDASGREVAEVRAGTSMTARLHYRVDRPLARPIFSLGLSDGRLGCFALASMLVDGEVPDTIEGEGHVDCTFFDVPLHPRVYELWGSVRGEAGFGDLVDWQRLRLFRVVAEISGAGRGVVAHSLADAPVRLPYRWHVNGRRTGHAA